MANYFIGVLLDASKNRDNKMEITEHNNKSYYRIGGFGTKWNFKKAKELPCTGDILAFELKQAKSEMRSRGLSVPGVFRSKKR